MRQAFAGLLWSKQFYHYVVSDWLERRSRVSAASRAAQEGRNHEWTHLYNADVISMPDKWEYPWYAAWDLAFHCVPLALVDSEFAKEQLMLMVREWYMHPNGQLPAYEWAFGDVNPPVHAWAAWRVYKIEKKRRGVGDRDLPAAIFHKLLLNFTWWVNRKDAEGRNVFQGGFLGLDNIGVFDRSAPLPTGGHIEQADGTGWMAMYCLNLLAIAMELAQRRPGLRGCGEQVLGALPLHRGAINHLGNDGAACGVRRTASSTTCCTCRTARHVPMKVRSMVGLIPLFAVETLEPNRRRAARLQAADGVVHQEPPGLHGAMLPAWSTRAKVERRLLSIVNADQLATSAADSCWTRRSFFRPTAFVRFRVPQGQPVHSARRTARIPRRLRAGRIGHRGVRRKLQLARSDLVSRSIILLIESLQKFHHYLGDDFKSSARRVRGFT